MERIFFFFVKLEQIPEFEYENNFYEKSSYSHGGKVDDYCKFDLTNRDTRINIFQNHPPFNEFLSCETFCEETYKCAFYSYCIIFERICDGIQDCLLGDDEQNCG